MAATTDVTITTKIQIGSRDPESYVKTYADVRVFELEKATPVSTSATIWDATDALTPIASFDGMFFYSSVAVELKFTVDVDGGSPRSFSHSIIAGVPLVLPDDGSRDNANTDPFNGAAILNDIDIIAVKESAGLAGEMILKLWKA